MFFRSFSSLISMVLFTSVPAFSEPLGLKLFGLSLGDTQGKAMRYVSEKCSDYDEYSDYIVGRDCVAREGDNAEATLWVYFEQYLFRRSTLRGFRVVFKTPNDTKPFYRRYVKSLENDNLLQAEPEWCYETKKTVVDLEATNYDDAMKKVPAYGCETTFRYRLDADQIYKIIYFDVKGSDNIAELKIYKF